MSSARELDKSKAQPWTQDGAPRGMIKNAPHCDIPDGAVAYVRNAHTFPTEFQPRLGTRIYSEIQPPSLDGRTGYTAQKDGVVITSLSGAIFTATDVGNYFVWPGNPSLHDEIVEFVSDTQVRVRTSFDVAITAGCWLHARLNLNKFHSSEREMFFQWGRDVYVADDIAIASWTKALCVSRQKPANAISDYAPLNEYAVFANSGGIYQIDFASSPAFIWKKNTPVPAILPESTPWSKFNRKRYDHTYAMCRLSENGLRDRNTFGVKILQQSGPCALNPNTVPPRDYSINFLETKIDRGVRTQGELICGQLNPLNMVPGNWQALTGVASAVFRLTCNGQEEELLIDFGVTGYNVQSMDDVAAAIQDTIKTSFPFSTCVYDTDHFVFTSGEQELSTLDYLTPGVSVGYTNVSAVLCGTVATGATLDNLHPWSGPFKVGVLYVPKVPSEPTVPEQHWTHYSVFRTQNIGYQGVEPKVNEATGEILPPTKFHWVADVRVAGAFLVNKDDTGLVTALVGEFEEADVGTPIQYENGDIDTIYEYISPTMVMTNPSSIPVSYYDRTKLRAAAAIGGGWVIRATQTGNTVTWLAGTGYFHATDVGKTITWSTGLYSIITEYIDHHTVLVHDDIDKAEQGMTYDPIRRVFNDTMADEILRDREGEVHIGLLQNRFWTHLPECNVICTVPGFLLTAVRGDKPIHYCQLGTELKYLSGYYLSSRQRIDKIEDEIQTIRKAPNKFLVWCTNSFWGGPTNNPDVKVLPEFGDAYALIYVDVIDARLGCVDIGSIQEVEEGKFELRCTDNSWRQCTPFGYTAELGDMSIDKQTGQDIVKKDFKESQAISESMYGDNIGHVIWMRDE